MMSNRRMPESARQSCSFNFFISQRKLHKRELIAFSVQPLSFKCAHFCRLRTSFFDWEIREDM